ncbi:uncharacterized protein LOC127258963 [Andrographis paniculata]|uniref:uncharacterized protein LOC127258963 n=1 Tax=Andrographis paniculata TaxID=175694 RepID=UPI0021E8CBC4|nr:uncharacterized protein LOC127258963 [Andrographis paniculata]
MRIRRHAKISELLVDAAPSRNPVSCHLETYICKLNQSPWDVMTFPAPTTLSPPSFQVVGADASGGNGGSGRRTSVPESREIENTAAKKKERKAQCCKTDGKRWRCRREAAAGSSLCEHHVRNYQNLDRHGSANWKVDSPETVRTSSRAAKKVHSDSYELYCYSGFRRGWSKKKAQSTVKKDSSRMFDEKRDNELESELEEDEYGGDGDINGVKKKKKKKTLRKPIKERSLASLM